MAGEQTQHQRRRAADRQLDQLTGEFRAHKDSCTSHFDTLHKATNENRAAINNLHEELLAINQAVQPLKDLGSFFKVLKWAGGTLAALTPAALVLYWLFDAYNKVSAL